MNVCQNLIVSLRRWEIFHAIIHHASQLPLICRILFAYSAT